MRRHGILRVKKLMELNTVLIASRGNAVDLQTFRVLSKGQRRLHVQGVGPEHIAQMFEVSFRRDGVGIQRRQVPKGQLVVLVGGVGCAKVGKSADPVRLFQGDQAQLGPEFRVKTRLFSLPPLGQRLQELLLLVPELHLAQQVLQ